MTGVFDNNLGEDEIQALLAQYASDSLLPVDRRRVESWLEDNPQLQAQVEFWEQLRAGLHSQPQLAPGPNVWRDLHQQVTLRQRLNKRNPVSALVGVALATVCLLLLWFTIRPGVMLRWTVSGGDVLTYQVYRAPSGSQDFILLGEVPASPAVSQYRYLDALFIPGQSYVYRVEAISQFGSPIVSQRVVSQPAGALPGQLAILLASLLMGFLAASLARSWEIGKPERLAPA
jgi:hypothetical protein